MKSTAVTSVNAADIIPFPASASQQSRSKQSAGHSRRKESKELRQLEQDILKYDPDFSMLLGQTNLWWRAQSLLRK